MSAMSSVGTPDRLQDIYLAVAARDGDPSPSSRLRAICDACVDLLPVAGAGIMLMAERVHQGTYYATDQRLQVLEDLQNSASQGPCLDAYNLARPVMEPDLAGEGRRRWPLLAPAAVEAGMRAVFGFPLMVDDTSVGALDLYRDTPGPLSDSQVADARLLAAMAAREVLAAQAEAPPGSLPARMQSLSGDRATIEQATGMAAAQTDRGITLAGELLRALARELHRPLDEVARDVVARKVRVGAPDADENVA